MRSWFDVRHVQFVELGDIAENVSELRLKFLFLLRRERQPREMRDVFHIKTLSRHAREARERSSKFKVQSGVLVWPPARTLRITPRRTFASAALQFHAPLAQRLRRRLGREFCCRGRRPASSGPCCSCRSRSRRPFRQTLRNRTGWRSLRTGRRAGRECQVCWSRPVPF